jgi:glycosyltransferase involved in cell wall biosynthesis
MRIGVNPEKYKQQLNRRFLHRIIVPVYIPDNQEDYHSESHRILEKCLASILATISDQTAVTVVNNGSSEKVSRVINKYAGQIDKVVNYNQNKGKVYSFTNEARSCFEPYISLIDADVYVFPTWENEVFKVFKSFSKCGVVAPLPCQGLAFNHNCSVFFDNYLQGKIKYAKVVSDEDCDLYLQGLGNIALHKRNKHNFNWRQKQYALDGKIKAIIGAGHFIATYRSDLFKGLHNFPEKVFENGYEDQFIDQLADIKGYYRLSTVETHAYHMGNKIDDYIESLSIINDSSAKPATIILSPLKDRSNTYYIRNLFFRALRKYRKL